jgi:hypothetical protein
MKYFTLLITAFLMQGSLFSQTSALREPLKELSSDLELRYKGRPGIKIALLEFRTSDDRLLPFNAFIRDEFVLNYQKSTEFKLIDPFMSAKVATDNAWSMKTVSSFPYYEKLGRQFMEKTGYVPDAYIYGQIQDNQESITITAYMVFTGSTDAKVIYAISFPSDEQTDRLLGKPVKIRPKVKPAPDTVYVEKRIEVKSDPDTVYVERLIVVEPEVEIAPQAEPEPAIIPSDGLPAADYEQFHFQLTEIRYIGDKLYIRFTVVNNNNIENELYIGAPATRIITNEGDEYLRPEVSLGSAQSNYSVNKKLVSGIPMKAELVFSQIPPDLTIKLLEISVQDGKIMFKELPVGR